MELERHGSRLAGWIVRMAGAGVVRALVILGMCGAIRLAIAEEMPAKPAGSHAGTLTGLDFVSMLFVFMLATIIGLGVIRRVSRLLHTPLMSLTNAISAIAVIGAIIVAGGEEYPTWIRVMGSIALFASMTNIISGFMITDRMLKMFKETKGGQS
jgi:NAD(P) transhydrogenase subunit alpha